MIRDSRFMLHPKVGDYLPVNEVSMKQDESQNGNLTVVSSLGYSSIYHRAA